jgi:hypothetical protein
MMLARAAETQARASTKNMLARKTKMKKPLTFFMRGWLCDVSLFYVDKADCSGFNPETK